MNLTDKKQIQLHKMELDEKYLSRKLLEISQNKPLIVGNLKKFKAKCKGKHKNKAFVHEKAFIKILKINKRIMRILIDKKLIPRINICGLNLYKLADIEQFLKNNNSIYKLD